MRGFQQDFEMYAIFTDINGWEVKKYYEMEKKNRAKYGKHDETKRE